MGESITIEGVRMSMGAARNVEATNTKPAADVARVRAGLSRRTLLAECMEGCDDPETGDDWREYVDAVMAAAEVRTYRVVSSQGVALGEYEATSERHALDEMARAAGYRDQAHAAEVAGPFEGRVIDVEAALEGYARDVARDNGVDTATAVRMMRDESGQVALDLGLDEETVDDWCGIETNGFIIKVVS